LVLAELSWNTRPREARRKRRKLHESVDDYLTGYVSSHAELDRAMPIYRGSVTVVAAVIH
jgi:hypothetical protein